MADEENKDEPEKNDAESGEDSSWSAPDIKDEDDIFTIKVSKSKIDKLCNGLADHNVAGASSMHLASVYWLLKGMLAPLLKMFGIAENELTNGEMAVVLMRLGHALEADNPDERMEDMSLLAMRGMAEAISQKRQLVQEIEKEDSESPLSSFFQKPPSAGVN